MTVGLQDRTLARLLAAKAAAEASGIVEATRGKLKRLFCLEQGWLVFAVSNLIEEQLDEFMLREKRITPGDRASVTGEASKRKKKIVELLIEREIVSRETVRKSMEELLESLLGSCLEWPDGQYRFSAGRPDLPSDLTVRLDLPHLVLRHARHWPASLDAVRVRIGPPDFCPERTDAGDRMLESLESRGVTDYLLRSCTGKVGVGDLVGDSPAGEEETLRNLYGLLLLGAVDEPTHKPRAVPSRDEAPLTEEECVAVLRKAREADYYGILGLERGSTRDQIRDAYYSLARRYHPDRFRSGDMHVFLDQMETYFTKVTEAYNTLFNNPLRKDYDRHLAERAAGPAAASDATTAHVARRNFLRARELIERRRFAEAVTFLENAIRQDDSVAEYHLELGVLLSGNPRRRADAEEHLLRAAEIDPSSPAAYFGLGNLYRKAMRHADAARMFRETLRWDPGHSEAAAQLAELGDAGEDTGDGGILRHLFRG